LIGLGWSTREADDAITGVAAEAERALADGADPDIGALLRSALRSLSRT
jgi:Holliday junction DNA helicase RuvA